MRACVGERLGEDVTPERPSRVERRGGEGTGPRPPHWTVPTGPLSSHAVTPGSEIMTLWPRWMTSAGAMLQIGALVRSRCVQCAALLRVELEDVVARHGPDHDLFDRLERCRAVGCIGSTYYLAARTYGGDWRVMLRDPAMRAKLCDVPPTRAPAG